MGTKTNSFSYEIPKQRSDIITDTELFNSENLQAASSRLDEIFEEFANTLMELNELVNESVNVSPESCVFGGGYGAQLLDMWNQNTSTFSDFKSNFNAWSQAITVIANRNLNTDAIVKAIYNNRTTGADLMGSGNKTISQIREEIMEQDAIVSGTTNSRNGETLNYYDDNGNLIMKFKDENGNVWMEHVKDENGRVISTICTDENGNTSEITIKRDSTGKETGRTVVYKDKDGNILDSAPDSFSDRGYLQNVSTAQKFLNEHGAPDGSLEWQEAFQSLSNEDQAAVLAANNGKVNDDLGTNYGLTSDVPTNGEYDGRNIVVPELSESDFDGLSNEEQVSLKNSNAQSIVDSAYAVQTNIDGEAAALTTLKTNLESNESYKALSAEKQTEIQNYLQGQIDSRTTLSSNITEECKSGAWTVDGTIGDATTYVYAVEDGFLGSGSHFQDYNEAVQTAKSWNETINSMDDLNKTTAVLNSYGVFF